MYQIEFLTDLRPFKKGDKIICKPLQYGFAGGFDSNCHGGQWTTEGNIEACVIVEVLKSDLSEKNNLTGHVLNYELCSINLINLDSI